MAAETIGRCKCPLCSSDRARLSLAKSKLSVITCNACNFQGFARSDRSDDKLRALLIAEPAAPPADDPPAPPAPTAAAPQPAPATRAPMGWGVLGHA